MNVPSSSHLSLHSSFGGAYAGKKVFITGHTGFKGSWLALWLSELGAQITGVALDSETTPNHWGLLQLEIDDRRLDISQADALQNIFADVEPEIVFHLAAQPLVRRSYADPLTTWRTNVVGTANVLEACRNCPSVKAIVVVTSDKCYENREWERGYIETDRLGGHDPYSASKAATELVADSFRKSFFSQPGSPLLATARAGNVIGGGDWSEDRLIPDLVRAAGVGKSLEIRSPHATRPWQHVLESLSGYLLLGQKLTEANVAFAAAWNFGPDRDGNREVGEVLELLKQQWEGLRWHVTAEPQPHEAHLLYLDSSKARCELGWKPVWSLSQGLKQASDWYRTYVSENRVISREQLADYVDTARSHQMGWTK